MKFNIYFGIDKKNLIKSNVSKEDVITYLKTLTPTQKSYIFIDPVEEKIIEHNHEEEER